jgi:deoxycytidylate deaminase
MNKFEYVFENHINLLKKIAQHSSLQHKHGACLIKRGEILSFGYNKYIKKHFIENTSIKYTIHAEVDALCKIPNKSAKGMDILIIRIGTNKLKNSRPCNSCIDKLSRYGIRKVYYSNEAGNIVCEFLDSMPKLHVSSGFKFRNKIN